MAPLRIVDALPDNDEAQRALFAKLPKDVQAIIGKGLANRTVPLSEDDSLAVLTACIGIGVGRAEEKALGKTAVMVVGNTGAGKSTFVNYIMGCELETVNLRVKGKLTPVCMVSETSDVKEVMSIGHRKTSHSFVPELEEAKDMNAVVVDCPGFLDNRGAEISIANAANIKAVMARADGVTLVAVLNYHSLEADRGRGVRELLDTLLSLFGSVDRAIIRAKSILLVVSHVPLTTDYGRMDLDTVKNKFDSDGLSPKMTNLLEALLENVCIFHPENKGGESWLKAGPLAERIKNSPPISDPAEVFKIVLSTGDEDKLRKLVEALFRRVQTALEADNYKASAKALSDMKRLEIVDHVAVTRLLESAKKRVSQEFVNRILEAQSCVVLDNVQKAAELVAEFREILEPFKAEAAASDMLDLVGLVSRADFLDAAIASRKEELVRREQQSKESKEFATTLEGMKRDLAVAEAHRLESLEREKDLKSELAQLKSKAAVETESIQAEDKARLEALEEKLNSASKASDEEKKELVAAKAELEAKLERQLRERQEMEAKQAEFLSRLLKEQETSREETEKTERTMREAIAKEKSKKEAAEAKAAEAARLAEEVKAQAERDRLAAEEAKKVEEARRQAEAQRAEEEKAKREAEEARKAEETASLKKRSGKQKRKRRSEKPKK